MHGDWPNWESDQGRGATGTLSCILTEVPNWAKEASVGWPMLQWATGTKTIGYEFEIRCATARCDFVTDFRIFRIFEICGSESSFAPLEEIVRNARIDSMIIDQCMAIHSGIYLDSIILINHH